MESITINKLFGLIDLPKRYYGEKFNLKKTYKEEHSSFIHIIQLCHGEEFKDKDKQHKIKEAFSMVKEKADRFFDMIEKIIEFEESADHSSSQNVFDQLMLEMYDYLNFSTIDGWTKLHDYYTHIRITPARSFFRVRSIKSRDTKIENNPDQIFHLPYEMRDKASSERFSAIGLPALYLASMLPLAWEETGIPARYYFSEFQYDRSQDHNTESLSNNEYFDTDMNFLSLYSPMEINAWGIQERHNNFDIWIKFICDYLITYPLILACSFVNDNKSAIFKQEYIISQMLMNWVIRNNDKCYGISYFTCIDTTEIPDSNWCAYNVVIPAKKEYNDKGQSIDLLNSFTWTKPTFYELPICDVNKNMNDRKELTALINEMIIFNSDTKIQTYTKTLCNYIKISANLRSLLAYSNDSDVHLILVSLVAIDNVFSSLESMSSSDIVQEAKIECDNSEFDESVFSKKTEEFKKLMSKASIIKNIISDYKNSMWNYGYHHHSYIVYFSNKTKNIDNVRNYLKTNNVLFSFHNISNYDNDKLEEFVNNIELNYSNENTHSVISGFIGGKIPENEGVKAWLHKNIDEFNYPLFEIINNKNGNDGFVVYGADIPTIKDIIK